MVISWIGKFGGGIWMGGSLAQSLWAMTPHCPSNRVYIFPPLSGARPRFAKCYSPGLPNWQWVVPTQYKYFRSKIMTNHSTNPSHQMIRLTYLKGVYPHTGVQFLWPDFALRVWVFLSILILIYFDLGDCRILTRHSGSGGGFPTYRASGTIKIYSRIGELSWRASEMG